MYGVEEEEEREGGPGGGGGGGGGDVSSGIGGNWKGNPGKALGTLPNILVAAEDTEGGVKSPAPPTNPG